MASVRLVPLAKDQGAADSDSVVVAGFIPLLCALCDLRGATGPRYGVSRPRIGGEATGSPVGEALATWPRAGAYAPVAVRMAIVCQPSAPSGRGGAGWSVCGVPVPSVARTLRVCSPSARSSSAVQSTQV